MPDYYNPAGENYKSRDSVQLSDVSKAIANDRIDARDRQMKNRALIHDAFPPQGNVTPNHEGSQSMAPNAPTTPDMPIMSPSGTMY